MTTETAKNYQVFRKYDGDEEATLVKSFKTRAAAEKFAARKNADCVGDFFVWMAE